MKYKEYVEHRDLNEITADGNPFSSFGTPNFRGAKPSKITAKDISMAKPAEEYDADKAKIIGVTPSEENIRMLNAISKALHAPGISFDLIAMKNELYNYMKYFDLVEIDEALIKLYDSTFGDTGV